MSILDSIGDQVGRLYVLFDADGRPYIKGLRDLDRETDASGRRMESTWGKYGKRAGMAAAAGLAIIATAAAGIGVATVKAAATFEYEMSRIKVNASGTSAEMAKLQKTVIQLGKDTVFSAGETAQAANELVKAGLSIGQTIEALPGMLALASAGELDVAQAAELAANALTMFNLSAKDTEAVADTLSLAANRSTTEVDLLGLSLQMAGTVAAQAGLTLQETAAALALMANNGLKGSDAGTSLKQMFMQLMGPSDKARQIMQQYGIAAYDANGEMLAMDALLENVSRGLEGTTDQERDFALATIFGSDAVRAANILLKEGAGRFRDMTAEVSKSGAAQEIAATKMDNLKGSYEQLKGSLETLAIALGEKVLPVIREFVDDLTAAANEALETGDWGAAGEMMGRALAEGLDAAAPFIIEATTAILEASMQALITAAPRIIIQGMAGMAEAAVEGSWAAGEGAGAALWGYFDSEQTKKEFRRIKDQMREEGLSAGKAWQEALQYWADNPVRMTFDQYDQIKQWLGLDWSQSELEALVRNSLLSPDRMAAIVAEQQTRASEQLKNQIQGKQWPSFLWEPGSNPAQSFIEQAQGMDAATQAATELEIAQQRAAEQAARLEEYTKSLSGVFGDMVSPADAWGEAVEKSAKRAGKAVDEFDATKTNLKDYAKVLEDQLKAWTNFETNMGTLASRWGDEFTTDVLMHAAAQGPDVIQALIGGDDETVRRILTAYEESITKGLDDTATTIEQKQAEAARKAVEAAKKAMTDAWSGYATDFENDTGYTPIASGGKVYSEGEAYAANWYEGYANYGIPSKIAADLVSTDTAKPAAITGGAWESTFLGQTVGVIGGVESQLDEIDGGPAGSGIGAQLVAGIRRQLAAWKPTSITIPLNFQLSPYEGEGGGSVAGAGSRAGMLDFADNFLGRPYVWGGTSPSGWDCSGYVGYVLSKFGVQHPRTAAAMQAYFPKAASPRPGDLLFYGSPATHVAMYYGNGQQIEARGRKWGTGIWPVRNYTSVGRVPMYAMGGPVLPPPQRSTGPEVPAILHAGEYVLTQNQAAALFSGAPSFADGGWVPPTSIMGSYISREAARYASQQAIAGDYISASELAMLTATLDRQIEFIAKAVAEAQKTLDAAKQSGTQEQINEAAEALFNLQGDAADARRELEALARTPLEQAASRWASAIGQLGTMMDLVGNHSGALGLQSSLLPSLLGSMGGSYQTAVDLMNSATDPSAIMGYGSDAIGTLSSMFGAEQGVINRALSDTLASIDASQSAWESSWNAQASAMEDSISRQQEALQEQQEALDRAQRDELDALNQFYSDKLRALDDGERSITRAQQRNRAGQSLGSLEDQLRILQGQGYYTEADVARMRELETQIQEQRDSITEQEAAWAREDERARLQREQQEAVKSLQQQQEMERIALQDQIEAARRSLEAQQQAFEQQRIAQQQSFEQQRQQAQAAAQREIDALVTKYQTMMQEVMNRQNELLGEAGDYHNAGYTLGVEFANGLLAALPNITGAANTIAEAVSNILELHSPAKEGPLSNLDQWWDAFLPTLVQPLDTYRPAQAATAVASGVQTAIRSEEVIRVEFSGNATGLDVYRLADIVEDRIKSKIEIKRWGG